MKKRPNVLVMLGWNDPRYFVTIGRYARQAGWYLETRAFFTETIPYGWQGDGMIVSYTERSDAARFIRQQAPQQPLVIIGGSNPGITGPVVTNNNRAIGPLVVQHFLERGHRHFAWYGLSNDQTVCDRRDGFRTAVEKAGYNCQLLEYPARRSKTGSITERHHWLAKQLSALPRPLALMALDDQVASEAVAVCVSQGWRVPEDIAVIGVGNIEVACECSHVPLTSVDIREEEMVHQAAVLLDQLMKGKRPPREPILIEPGGVVARGSTDALAVTQPEVLKAIRFMEQNLARPVSMDDVAEAAGLSRRMLYYYFQQELHRSPVAYLQDQRMDLARKQLTGSDQTIGKIAAACGFNSVRTLNRSFWRQEKMSPRTWRRNHGGGGNNQ